jgi:hypothetical protein
MQNIRIVGKDKKKAKNDKKLKEGSKCLNFDDYVNYFTES